MAEYVTPLMQQFADIKREYSDCLILFRLGDFYELFDEDAKIGAAILDITLTRKAQSKGGDVPMAGIPYHALDSYLHKLVSAGHKVAIAEQIGEPDGRTLVERKVVRIVTPGTILDEGSLETKQNSYVLTLVTQGKILAFAVADITTGQLITAEESAEQLETTLSDLLTLYQPKECVLPEGLYNDPAFLALLKKIQPELNISFFSQWPRYADQASRHIQKHFNVQSLTGFQIEDKPLAQTVVATLLGYLEYTQRDPVRHIRTIVLHQPKEWVALDRATITNLELLTTLRDGQKKGSLLYHLDQTQTAMGGRLLRQWIVHPLRNIDSIFERQNIVTHFTQNVSELKRFQEILSAIGDIERLLAKLSVGIGNARDVARLQQSLQQALKIQSLLHTKVEEQNSIWQSFTNPLAHNLQKLTQTIATTLEEDPPFDPRQGGIIRSGVHAELDSLREQVEHSQDWMLALEKEEREKTGITTLKIRSNKVFGFYIEVSNSHKNKVPNHYERKQTLVNSERYFTAELKEKEVTLLTAEEKSQKIEFELFQQLVNTILEHTDTIQYISHLIAKLDCLTTLAAVSLRHQYTAPQLTETSEIHITAGRHPVVETILTEEPFVPNDTALDKTQQLHLITGPNMAGKSVYIRQVALITILAHMGSHVPAEKATISLVDKIFVRSGASDIITAGLSTFMVEMVETAYILRNATPQSLIIMDEIGRGTSTYDGISIAQSVAEYIATTPNCQAKTLFATHYHELQELAGQYDTIHNFQVAVEEHHGEPIFLHRVLPGGADHSYGVAVAQLAGLPDKITKRAKQKLRILENQRQELAEEETTPLHTEISDLDLSTMTPVEALNYLAKWQKKLKT